MTFLLTEFYWKFLFYSYLVHLVGHNPNLWTYLLSAFTLYFAISENVFIFNFRCVFIRFFLNLFPFHPYGKTWHLTRIKSEKIPFLLQLNATNPLTQIECEDSFHSYFFHYFLSSALQSPVYIVRGILSIHLTFFVRSIPKYHRMIIIVLFLVLFEFMVYQPLFVI